MWVRLPDLPIEYYELSVLRDIGKAIGLVLRIDTHTASESRGRFARICVQVNFNEPILKLVKVGGIDQPMQYEGIGSLYFSCGRVGHKAEGCPYTTKSSEKSAMAETRDESTTSQDSREKDESEPSAFRPWVLVARKRKQSRHAVKTNQIEASLGLLSPPSRFLYAEAEPFAELTCNSDMTIGSAICADRTIEVPLGSNSKSSHVNSKELKPRSIPKGKKSMVQARQSVTIQKNSTEWKIIKNMESKTTKQKSH